MSTTIDNRVVEMRFDNKQFESGISTSLSSIEKLERGLKLDGATKGLENISTVASKFSLSGIGSAVETVNAKFSALEVMAVTALANITNSAVNAGKRIVASLTIDPIKSGFQEYELKMGSVQTIMASTGESLETVNKYLEELNKYSDQTIYSFSDMTQNIGKFTNAGVKLEDAVLAIKGISNEAAVSGANANEASRAMYNFAQALSAGYVKLIDWKSIENANMATVEFKNELLETALALGTVVKQGDKYKTTTTNAKGSTSDWFNATMGFNDALNNQWMTTEVLVQTLGRYADESTDIGKKAKAAATEVKTLTMLYDTLKEAAQSGWAQTWELVVGDFDEAKALFTELSDLFGNIIGKSAEARNKLIGGALDGGSGSWSDLKKQVEDAGGEFSKFEEVLKETARGHNIAIDDMIKKEGSLEATLKSGWLTSGIITESLNKYIDDLLSGGEATADMAEKLAYYQKMVDEVWRGEWDNGAARRKALVEAGHDRAGIQRLVNMTVDQHRLTLQDLSDAELINIGYTEEQIKKLRELADEAGKANSPLNELIESLNKPSGRELLIDSFRNALNGIIKVCGAVKTAWTDTFPPTTSEQLYNVIAVIHRFTEVLDINDDKVDQISRTCKGLFAILDIVGTIVGGPVKLAFELLKAVLGAFDMDILEFTANVGDAIVAFRDWIDEHNYLAKGIEFLIPKIRDACARFREWSDEHAIFENGFKGVLNIIAKVRDKLGDWIEELKKSDNIPRDILLGIVNGLKTGATSVYETIKGVATGIIDYFCDVLGIQSPSTEFIEKAKDICRGILVGLKEGSKDVYNAIRDIASKCLEEFKAADWDWGAIAGVALGAGTLAVTNKMADSLGALADPLSGLTELFEGLGKTALAKSKELKSEALLNLAKAVGIMVVALVALTMIDTAKLWDAVGVLGAVAGILAALSFVAGRSKSLIDLGKSLGSLVGIGAAVLLVSMAMKNLADIEVDDIPKILAGLGSIVVGLGALIAACSLLTLKGETSVAKLGTMMLGMSAAMWIIVEVIEKISGLSNEEIERGIEVISAIETLFAAVIVLSVFSGKHAGQAGLMFLEMAVAIGILIGVIEKINKLSRSEIEKGLAVIGVIEILFGAIMALSLFAGKNSAKAGLMFLEMSAAIAILVGVIKDIADINPADIEKGLGVIAGISAMFGALMALSGLAGKNSAKAGFMFIETAAAILILVGAISILSMIDTDGLTRATGCVTILMSVLGAIMAVSKLAADSKGSLITITVAVGLLVAAVAAMTLLDQSKIETATICLTALLGALALVVAAASFGKYDQTKSLIVISIMIAELAGIMWLLSELPVDSTMSNVTALSILVSVMAGVMAALGVIKTPSKGALLALAAIGLVFAEAGLVLGLLDALNIEPSIESATALSILVGAMTGVTAALGAIGKSGLASGATAGIVALAEVIGGIALIVGILGGLVELFPQLETFLDKGIPILDKIGGAIGTFLGNIVGGFIGGAMEGIVASLPNIGTNLSEFMDELGGFIEGSKKIDGDVIAGVAGLVGIILALTAADIINGIGRILVGGVTTLTSFGEQLGPFGSHVAAYAKAVEGIDASKVTASSNAAKAIGELVASLPRTGGVFQDWFGEKLDLSSFGTQLQKFAVAITDYSAIIVAKGVDGKAVEDSVAAGQALAKLASNLPRTGGVLQEWLGETMDLETFGFQIKKFAQAIVSYSSIITRGGVDGDAIEASTNAGRALSELANGLPRSGGVLQEWLGETMDLETFGFQIKKFAQAIANYSSIVSRKGIDEAAIEASVKAGTMLSNLANSLPSTRGIIAEWFLGKQISMTDFGEQIKKFAISLVTYSTTVKDVDSGAVEGSKVAAEMLVNLANSLPDKNGAIASWFLGDKTTMDKFGQQIVAFGTAMVTYSETVNGTIAKGAVKASVDAAQFLVDLANRLPTDELFKKDSLKDFGKNIAKFGEYMYDYYDSIADVDAQRLSYTTAEVNKLIDTLSRMGYVNAETVSSFSSALTSVANAGINGFIGAFTNATERVRNTAKSLITNFVSGIDANKSSLTTALVKLNDSSLDIFANKEIRFYVAGANIITELLAGVIKREDLFIRRISNIISDALTKIKDKYPDFYSTGQTLMTKLADGIEYRKTNVKAASGSVASESVARIEDYYQDFYDAGKYLVEGFAAGIEDTSGTAEEAAAAMASAAAEAAAEALDENSPSKVGYDIGDFFGIGFVNAILDNISNSYSAGEEIANSARKGLFNTASKLMSIMDGDFDIQPRITPVIDMTNVERGFRTINSLSAQNRAVSVGGSFEYMINEKVPNRMYSNAPTAGNNFSFTQNNYSPKSLSRVEIYRQTKNQFSAMEKMVKT